MEKPKEKTPEQIFSEKFLLQENNTNHASNLKKESFPWTQKNTQNDQNNTVNYIKYLEELLERNLTESPKLDTPQDTQSPTDQTRINTSIKKTQSNTISDDNIVKSIQRAA